MPFRASVCGHCRRVEANRACNGCGLWTCAACAGRGCGAERTAWTGRCRTCGALYPDDQRRDVLDDGDGEVRCASCGWIRRLRRLDLVVDPTITAALTASPPCASCGHSPAAELLVLHVQADAQTLYHLICRCGQTLGSAAT